MKSAVTRWRTVSRVLIRPNPCHIGQSNVTLWHWNSSCGLQTWQGCSYLISAPICFKKIAKFTWDVLLHAYLVKTCQKPAKPQPDPWPSLSGIIDWENSGWLLCHWQHVMPRSCASIRGKLRKLIKDVRGPDKSEVAYRESKSLLWYHL